MFPLNNPPPANLPQPLPPRMETLGEYLFRVSASTAAAFAHFSEEAGKETSDSIVLTVVNNIIIGSKISWGTGSLYYPESQRYRNYRSVLPAPQ